MGVYNPKAPPTSRRVTANAPTFVGPARPKYVQADLNVFDAALARIKWLYQEFDGQVTVSTSGGKDSTVILELACMAAKELGCLPVTAWWIDQECEFASTVDYQRHIMYERDDIELRWYQIPFYLENATNLTDQFLHVWGPGEDWVRPKEPGSIHDNVYGQDKWYELLAAVSSRDTTGCILDGVRAEESPARRLTTMSAPMYKWVTWAVVDADPATVRDPSTHRFRFHPIYDWSYRDVWKAISSNGWRYNAHYDHLFRHGVGVKHMRVSNFHHDQALSSLHWLQEVEPETWEAATKRLAGISTYGHLTRDQYPKELPYMFGSWTEYMDYLVEHLIPEPEGRAAFRHQRHLLENCCADAGADTLAQVIIGAVISGDYYGTQIKNFSVSHRSKRNLKAGHG